jgi:hypothetical protein
VQTTQEITSLSFLIVHNVGAANSDRRRSPHIPVLASAVELPCLAPRSAEMEWERIVHCAGGTKSAWQISWELIVPDTHHAPPRLNHAGRLNGLIDFDGRRQRSFD